MCGLVGAFGPPYSQPDWLKRSCELLRHRGPDDSGVWLDGAAGIAFGHTRLAVVDLSAAGHQPMVSACGRYRIAFNGEIYNHQRLRAELPTKAWRGHSDTETILECVAQWGLERTLASVVGMFALAVFDSRDRKLWLARDRFGEKPLYYGYCADSFVFASELRPLQIVPQFDATLDRMALESYMRHGCVPEPRSIYASIRKVPCGSWLEMTAADVQQRLLPSPRCYWSAIDTAMQCTRDLVQTDTAGAIVQLEKTLQEAVKGQMLSDVPLGAFLSGGIDSSTVVALMQSQSMQPVRTFSIGFTEFGYDESVYARKVAAHLGTRHEEFSVRSRDVLDLVPALASIYDEPFADSSQLPTAVVARLARRHVTVALSGDGGDELFCGYRHYPLGQRTSRSLAATPQALRGALARAVRSVRPETWDRIGRFSRSTAATAGRYPMIGDRLHKAADLLECHSAAEVYERLTSCWWREAVVLGVSCRSRVSDFLQEGLPEGMQGMMLRDTVAYLPNDILAKVDRATMAVSLEARIPLLDHRVFEFAWRLPMSLRMRAGTGKWLLRQVLHRYVPRELVERPKMGFAVPLAAWLRGPLRDWAEDLLNEQVLGEQGYLDPAPIRRRWSEHIGGVRNWQHELWNVLMFQAWLRRAPSLP